MAITYYRTAFGSHRHADYYCANSRRAIGSPDPAVIPAAEADGWTACEFCCTAEEIAASEQAAQAVADTMCPNTGVTNPRRIQSKCLDCGKQGTVNRNTGCLRAHKPQK